MVVGAGPNGLAAAIRIAQHGFSTLVLEGSDKVGGACRTEELTLRGFWHDVGSAVHPVALASPYFSSLPLEKYGLTWIQPEVPLAHPVSAGAVTVLQRSLHKTAEALGKDARMYSRIFGPIVTRSEKPIRGVSAADHPYAATSINRGEIWRSSLVVRPPIGSQAFFTGNRGSSLRGFSCTLFSAAVVRWFCGLWSYAGNAWPCGWMAHSERWRSGDF